MDYKDLINRVRRIEIKAKGFSQQILAGKYQSRFRGRGMAFSEVRNYNIGDDIRDIDWNVTARHSNPYVKIFEEEREQTVMLLVDMSGSNMWGTTESTKKDFIIEIAATLAFSAIENKDKVGAIIFTDKVEQFITPRSGKKHILSIIRNLISFEPKHHKTDIKIPLDLLLQAVKKRSTVFLISDFLQDKDSYKKELFIACRKHDFITIRIADLKEGELPNLGLVRLQDSETYCSTWVDTSDKLVRKRYSNTIKNIISEFDKVCKQNGIDNVHITVGEDYVRSLIGLFRQRVR